jgi:transposase-like protein
MKEKEVTLKQEAKESLSKQSLYGATWMGMLKKNICPSCKKPLPRVRKPTSLRQALFGGWTCPSCKIELNNKGIPINRK